MNTELYAAFILSSTILVLSPGPVNVMVMAHGTTHGWRAAMATNAGACVSLGLQLALTALGVSSLLLLLGAAFDLLRWLGAAYLVFLGVQLWRAEAAGAAAAGSPPPRSSLFWQGFLVSSTNPKSLLLFPVLFPRFVDPERPALLQLGVLALTFEIISLAGFAALAALAHRLQPILRSPRRARIRNRVFGGALIGLGAGMALES